jgi:hypothetical protein
MTHARLGVYARWFCSDCTTNQYAGRLPCRCCCGYTTDQARVVRGVLTVKGRLNARCLP